MIPIITVIVPLHNEEKYIDRLMESLRDQTHTRLQIILIDGGSEDRTGEKCDEWAGSWNMGPDSKMGIVEVIHTSDRGVSVSRNKGLDHATGDIVTFVDGDDYLEPDALECMLKCMQDNDADMVGCAFRSVYESDSAAADNSSQARSRYESPGSGTRLGNTSPSTGRALVPAYELSAAADIRSEESSSGSGSSQETACELSVPADFLVSHILRGDVHVWGRLYKRELIGRLRFMEGLTIGEDMLFVTEYSFRCKKIASMSYEGYNYYRNPQGAMFRPFTPSAMDQVRCFREERKLLETLAPDQAFGPALRSNMLISVMLTAGRISFLDKDIRKTAEYREYVKELRSVIREYKSRAAMKLLDRGYRLKVRIFRAFPGLYMNVYHTHRPEARKRP